MVNVQSRILGKLSILGYPGKILLNKEMTRAYIINDAPHRNNNQGLVIVNIENPSNPKLISSLVTDGKSKDIVLSRDEHYIYLLDAGKGLKVVDIENEESPEIVGELLLSGSTYQYGGLDLSADGTKLYIAHKGEIIVVDTQDSLLPEVITTIPYLGKVQDNMQPSALKDIMLSNKGTELYTVEWCYGLQEYNISDIENPKILYSESLENDEYCRFKEEIVANKEKNIIFATPESGENRTEIYAEYHSLAEKIAATFDAEYDWIDQDIAYQANYKFSIYDIYNPLNPVTLLSIGFGMKFGDSLQGIAVDESKHIAYVTNQNSGLIAINVDNIKQPIHHEPGIAETTIDIAEENLSLLTADDVLGHVAILKMGDTPIINMWTDLPKDNFGEIDCGYTYYAQPIDWNCEDDYSYFNVNEKGQIYINDMDSLSYESIGNIAPFDVYAKNEDGYISQQAKVMVNITENPDWTIQFQRPVIKIDSNQSIGSIVANVIQKKSQRALQLLDVYKYEDDFCNAGSIHDNVAEDGYSSYAEAIANMCSKSDYFSINTNGDITLRKAISEGNYSVNIFAVDRFGLKALKDLKIEVVGQ